MENDGVFGGEHSGKGVLLPSMHGVAYYYYVCTMYYNPAVDPIMMPLQVLRAGLLLPGGAP